MLLSGLLLALSLGTASADWAKKKGYDPIAWFLAGTGLLGMIFLLFLKNLNKTEMPEEEKQKHQSTGNVIGWVLSVVALVATILGIAINLS
jgi:hypothetical protein